MKNKVAYHASVLNESGASETAGSGRNLNELKAFVRSHYGAGWTVVIVKVENDNGIMDFEPVEVARFTIRK